MLWLYKGLGPQTLQTPSDRGLSFEKDFSRGGFLGTQVAERGTVSLETLGLMLGPKPTISLTDPYLGWL